MFDLPKSTEIRKSIHKKLIFQKFAMELNGDKRERFDADISRIVITNEISETSVNIRAGQNVQSIFVVYIELKNKEYDDKNIILISRLFGQKLLIVLYYANEYQLAIYETRLLKSEWKNGDECSLKIQGLDLENVWNSFVTQVSGIAAADGNTLDEQIEIEAEKEKLKKQIEDMERRARKEPQAKKKYEMHEKIREYRRKLEGK